MPQGVYDSLAFSVRVSLDHASTTVILHLFALRSITTHHCSLGNSYVLATLPTGAIHIMDDSDVNLGGITRFTKNSADLGGTFSALTTLSSQEKHRHVEGHGACSRRVVGTPKPYVFVAAIDVYYYPDFPSWRHLSENKPHCGLRYL